MKEVEVKNFFLPQNFDLGFDSSVKIPHFGVNKAINYCWGDTTLNEYDLDALCNIALYSQDTSTPNFVQYSPLTSPFLDDIFESIRQLNEEYFGFEIWGINSGTQFLFLNENKSVPDWQCVLKPGGPSEKLVAVMGISNPDAVQVANAKYLTGVRQLILNTFVAVFMFSHLGLILGSGRLRQERVCICL